MILWGLGPLGATTILTLTGTQFLLYLTDYVGIGAAVAGLVLFIAKMSDVFTDIAVGMASDMLTTRWGRRRPWLLGGTFLLTASCPLMFHIDRLAPSLRAFGATIAVIFFFTGYSMFYVPHQAMSAEMTQNYQERTSIVSWFYFFGALSFLIGAALSPELINWFGANIEGFHDMSFAIAIVPLATGLACIIGTRHAPATSRPIGARTPVSAWIRSMTGNRPLVILLASKLLHYFSVAVLLTGLVYFTLYVLNFGPSGMSIAGFSMTAGSLCGLYFFLRIAKVLQKHVVYSIALFGMGAAALSFGLLPAGSGRLVFGALCFAYGIAGAGLVMAQSMILDVCEWDFKRTGLRREGAVTSLISAMSKATPAFAALTVGMLLSAFGYVPGHPEAGQPPHALWAIRLCVSIVPGCLLVGASILLYCFYDLTREKLHAGPGSR